MVNTIRFNRPNLRFSKAPELLQDLNKLFVEGPYLKGNHIDNFERLFSNYLGIEFVFGVSSGTAALEIALRAIDAEPGDEILMTAHAGCYGTIVATRLGLTPVYFDINHDGTPNFDSFRERISIKTRGVILTNLYGLTCDISQFSRLCKKNSIFLIEDCAQSMGARYRDSLKIAGSAADFATFSFYPTKNLSTIGDAGAVTTRNINYAEKIRKLREYGWGDKYKVELAGGFNYRMDELHALVLSHQLSKLDEYNEKRRKIWGEYVKSLTHSSYELLGNPGTSFVAHLAVIKGHNINTLKEFLARKCIETATHYPIADYDQPAFKKLKVEELPNTDVHINSIVSIPLYPELKDGEINYVCEVLSEFSKHDK